MKYCEFCGAEIPSGQKCTCSEASKKKEKNKKRLVLWASVCALLILAVVVISSVAKTVKIDPAEYLNEPVFSGPDTMGKATVKFDKAGLIEKVMGKRPQKLTDEKLVEWLEEYKAYSDGINCEYVSNGLSNGDTFVVTITTTGLAAEKINSATLLYTVSGLEKVEIIDVFQILTIEFTGISGEGQANIVRTPGNQVVQACEVKLDKQGQLKNGDIVKLTVTNTENLAEHFNVILKETSKEFMVTGLGAYAKASDLPLGKIHEIANRVVAEKQVDLDAEGIAQFTYSDVKVYGIYFLEEKTDAISSSVNELHILTCYDFFVKGELRSTNYLLYIFKNLKTDANGNIKIEYDDGSHGGTFFTEAEAYFNKYEDRYTITEVG